MFKVLVTIEFSDRVVNYAQTVRELVGTMREDACQCTPCHNCHELPRIVHEQFTSSTRVVHDMFTSNSRTVHEQFMTTARQWRSRRCVGICVVSWTLLAFTEIASEETNYITATTWRLKQSRQNGTTCHDKIVAKSRANVSLALVFHFMLSGRISRNIGENIFRSYTGTTSENTDFHVLVA